MHSAKLGARADIKECETGTKGEMEFIGDTVEKAITPLLNVRVSACHAKYTCKAREQVMKLSKSPASRWTRSPETLVLQNLKILDKI